MWFINGFQKNLRCCLKPLKLCIFLTTCTWFFKGIGYPVIKYNTSLKLGITTKKVRKHCTAKSLWIESSW